VFFPISSPTIHPCVLAVVYLFSRYQASFCLTRITTGIKPKLIFLIVRALVTAARPSDLADATEPVVDGAHLTADVTSDLSIDVQLYQSINPDHAVVEVKKIRGDMFDFRNFFGKLQSHLTEAAFQEINIEKAVRVVDLMSRTRFEFRNFTIVLPCLRPLGDNRSQRIGWRTTSKHSRNSRRKWGEAGNCHI
jgi:hypothetical protein